MILIPGHCIHTRLTLFGPNGACSGADLNFLIPSIPPEIKNLRYGAQGYANGVIVICGGYHEGNCVYEVSLGPGDLHVILSDLFFSLLFSFQNATDMCLFLDLKEEASKRAWNSSLRLNEPIKMGHTVVFGTKVPNLNFHQF